MLFYLLCQVNSGRSNCSSECHRIPLKSLEVVQVYRRTAWPIVFLGQGAKRVLRLDFKKPSMRENSIETCILSRVKQITSPGWMHVTSARAWCTGRTQRDRVEREVGGGIGMGNTCKSMGDSCQCMTKPTTKL